MVTDGAFRGGLGLDADTGARWVRRGVPVAVTGGHRGHYVMWPCLLGTGRNKRTGRNRSSAQGLAAYLGGLGRLVRCMILYTGVLPGAD